VWDEEPGKVPHEVRPGPLELLGLRSEGDWVFYGGADQTPLFLHLLVATGDRVLAAELEPAWRAAGGWLARAVAEGDGLVRFARRAPGGLVHQGWRDTDDPGGPSGGGLPGDPAAPVADADTQAAALAGARAWTALTGDDALERRVRAAVAAAFGPETLAIGGDGRAVEGAGSHTARLLWAGAWDGAARDAAAARCCAPDVLTDWGVRTLSSEHPAFREDAYHRGSIWPFDCWFAWGGLRAAGRAEEAERVRAGVRAAVAQLGGAPELYAAGPRRLAIACEVQAWTAGALEAWDDDWDGRTW
jgi:glycogen debranching enzyme